MMRSAPGLALAGAGVAVSLGAHRALPGLRRSSSAWRSVWRSRTSPACRPLQRPGWPRPPGPSSSSASCCSGSTSCSRTSWRWAPTRSRSWWPSSRSRSWAPAGRGAARDLGRAFASRGDGFSICGVSAIAAANGVIDADEDEVAFSVALVTLCGTLAIITLPPLRGPLGLDDEQFGAWVGASVHDVAQVVATSSTAGSVALATAIVVKLTRVMLLAPLIAGIALTHRRPRAADGAAPPLVPPFIVAFVAMVVVASIGVIPDRLVARIDDLRTVFLGMALFALGTRVNVGRLRQIGARPLALGLASWLLIAVVAYAGVRLVWA